MRFESIIESAIRNYLSSASNVQLHSPMLFRYALCGNQSAISNLKSAIDNVSVSPHPRFVPLPSAPCQLYFPMLHALCSMLSSIPQSPNSSIPQFAIRNSQFEISSLCFHSSRPTSRPRPVKLRKHYFTGALCSMPSVGAAYPALSDTT